ncbi:WD40 repeat-like protein [Rhizopogon salebrosus TDB-379]|nr:WD40 repeat-like protein [Rhizopogon salebrosus TDB-379]
MSLPAAVTEEILAIRPHRRFEGHTHSVRGVIHLSGEQQIITCSLDGSLRVWSLQTGKQIGNDWRDGEDEVRTIALSLDGKKVVSGSGDGAIMLWDVDMGKVIAKWTGHKREVWNICWSRDGRRIVSGDGEGTVRVWDVESGKTVLVIETGFDEVYAVIYLPDTTMIATGGYSKQFEYLNIWGRAVKQPPYSQLVTTHNLYPSSARRQDVSAHLSLRESAPPNRISSPPRRNNHSTDDTSTQPDFLAWARNLFLRTRNRRNDEGIELQERRLVVVDVAPTRGKPRIYSRNEVEMKQEKEREKAKKAKIAKATGKAKARDANNAKITKSASEGSSRTPQNNVAQQPGGATLTQPTPELLSAGISTSFTTPAIAPTFVGTACCTGFWSAACCASPQNADGHR